MKSCYPFGMASKAINPRNIRPVRNLSPQAMNAIKAFKGLTAAPTPAKLKGKKAKAIERAVRTYFLG
jgi:hypothetical protein